MGIRKRQELVRKRKKERQSESQGCTTTDYVESALKYAVEECHYVEGSDPQLYSVINLEGEEHQKRLGLLPNISEEPAASAPSAAALGRRRLITRLAKAQGLL